MSTSSYGIAACKYESCPLIYPHSHLEQREPQFSNSRVTMDSPISQSSRQVTAMKNGNLHLHHANKNDRMHPKRESPRVFTPISSTRVKTKPHLQHASRAALYQPSLAAGGLVDLSRTFTLTPHGTFSFGGKKNLPKISSKAKLPLKSKRVSSQHHSRNLVKNHDLAAHREGSPLKGQQSISPKSNTSSETSDSTSVLEHKKNSLEQENILGLSSSSIHIASSLAPLLETQMIIPNQRTTLSNMKETVFHRVQRQVQTSYVSTVTDSYFPNVLS